MYIDDGSDEPLTISPQQVEQPQLPSQRQVDDIRTGMQGFFELANAGHFAVDHTTGHGLIKWARGVSDWIAEQAESLRLIAQPMPMSETPTARQVSMFMRDVASDAQGIVPQLKALAETLPRYERAIRKAMESYQETEELARDTFRRQVMDN